MSISAANSAGPPYVSLCPCRWTNQNSISRYVSNHYRRSFPGDVSSSRIAVCLDFREPKADENFVLKAVCRFVSRLMLGHRFGAFPAPGGTRSSASHYAPLRGPGSSQNKFRKHSKERPRNFFRAPPRKQTLTKGAHVQVEGELRSREYESKKTNSKQRVWEIRVSSILKLDRAEKSAPEDQDHDEATQEETAA